MSWNNCLEFKLDKVLPALVALYDSLNSQIEKIQEELNQLHTFAVNPLDESAVQSLDKFIREAEARTSRLEKMRDDTEKRLQELLSLGDE